MIHQKGSAPDNAALHDADYRRIANAIEYLQQHFKEQPALDKVAAAVSMSPFHFQRMFTEWAGISPKKFVQYLSLDYAKQLLATRKISLLDTAHATGLSGTGRLHDLFVRIESMTPGDYKNGGAQLTINYSFADSPFGEVLVASTSKGICHLAFQNNEAEALAEMQSRLPNASYYQSLDSLQQNALSIFENNEQVPSKMTLHLNGTPFQLKVWESLLQIPEGQLATYGALAKAIDRPKASRAVGTAIGSNPVALLIPCHRVIQASGGLGGYRWGPMRKAALIAWEASKTGE